MSKEQVISDQVLTPTNQWKTEYKYNDLPGIKVSRDDELSILVGQLLTYVDATYTDYEQRKAHKRLVKDTVYNWYYNTYDNQHKEPSLRGYSREMSE